MNLTTLNVTFGYGSEPIIRELTTAIPASGFTAIVGPNGCGKSTLLRGLAKLLKPQSGAVLLDGTSIADIPARSFAQNLGMLPQQPIAPDGITVADLISRGRHPHQRWFRQWSDDDERAVLTAMQATGVAELGERNVDELSGGQRQRVWIALALAQNPDIMLLDEPTTFLDLAHQVDVLDLLQDLHRDSGRTIVAVLHDLNLAARYADHLIVMKGGKVVAAGAPSNVVTSEIVEAVFGLPCIVIDDPLTGTPLVVPAPRAARSDTLAQAQKGA
ncbi:ABC transporter ATP-binding protein [Hoyosella rhizosphaerae]|uniref:ABC transporter n=1 Tax=Hoyosella rhizosphaerae TaxID=1755582 RepID=A0A916XD64_9ACTN|nr:ABC transporter ATP-binding protein [Hoyosella rhizosphaerae]MBN4927606.1 ABC transporter ATP-binding protein [Hoyosella rhizosphaerae]GGC63137.1 ABC transporter [Hoyosella rhizosphaerae]